MVSFYMLINDVTASDIEDVNQQIGNAQDPVERNKVTCRITTYVPYLLSLKCKPDPSQKQDERTDSDTRTPICSFNMSECLR